MRYQWIGLLVVIFIAVPLSYLLFHFTQRRFLKPKDDLTVSLWKQNSLRLISPFIFLILTLLCMSGFRSFNLPTDDFIKPALTYLCLDGYRLVGIFTTNRAWLRTIAVFLFGLAALQSFGILSVTLNFLEMISFQFGERQISVLDLLNGIGILLLLLWGSSLIGGVAKRESSSYLMYRHLFRFYLRKYLEQFWW